MCISDMKRRKENRHVKSVSHYKLEQLCTKFLISVNVPSAYVNSFFYLCLCCKLVIE